MPAEPAEEALPHAGQWRTAVRRPATCTGDRSRLCTHLPGTRAGQKRPERPFRSRRLCSTCSKRMQVQPVCLAFVPVFSSDIGSLHWSHGAAKQSLWEGRRSPPAKKVANAGEAGAVEHEAHCAAQRIVPQHNHHQLRHPAVSGHDRRLGRRQQQRACRFAAICGGVSVARSLPRGMHRFGWMRPLASGAHLARDLQSGSPRCPRQQGTCTDRMLLPEPSSEHVL